MDNTNRRPKLPALSFLESKREDVVYHNHLGLSTNESPTYHCPPPPYSQAHNAPLPAQHANDSSDSQPTVHTPPESRRTTENEKESAKQTRQSLPSISEALGVDSKTTYAPMITPASSFQPANLPQPQSATPASPSPKSRRSIPMEPPSGYSTSFPGSSHSQYSQYRSEPPAQQSYSVTSEPVRAPIAGPPVPETKSPMHPQTSQPAPRSGRLPPFAHASERSPTYEPPQPAGSMGPPSSFAYGYTPYPPRYANPIPSSSVSSGPTYQPSTIYGPQSTAPGWRGEGSSRLDDRQPGGANYGENVKRHLDFYDLEMALNEVASTSGILSDFSRRYGDRMHHTQRAGASLSTLPGLVEVDDMVAKTRVQLDSLLKIRDVVLAQQAVYEQQVADQRQQRKAFNEVPAPQPEHHPSEPEDAKNGVFTGVDMKKRRGRAAPPGRCHSCNRAETPEWRRGPDGARTLCNACGLHYAKLTRKNNGANKNTTIGSSNLRPKENVAQ